MGFAPNLAVKYCFECGQVAEIRFGNVFYSFVSFSSTCLACFTLYGLANYDQVVQNSAQKNYCYNDVAASEGDASTQIRFAILIF